LRNSSATHRYSPAAIDMHFVLDMMLASQALDMCFAREEIRRISYRNRPNGDYIEFAAGKYIELNEVKHIDK